MDMFPATFLNRKTFQTHTHTHTHTHAQAVMTNADGSPSLGSSARVTVTINNGQRTLLDSEIASNSVDGKIAVAIPIPSDANCLKIKVHSYHEFTRRVKSR